MTHSCELSRARGGGDAGSFDSQVSWRKHLGRYICVRTTTTTGASLKQVVFLLNCCANSVTGHVGWTRLRDAETGTPAPGMAPSREDDGGHGGPSTTVHSPRGLWW